ncbi:bis(5'-nucleosyl)-tetraphosphatase (symmetrical) ApaH [Candidatus Williamhamiltonella defendens]|uniref:bis(5'-nucleosyl)-tetraphosphatase (symmetrical) ApaH n=1 Tax=Candidatus Williamhamiltonella defendens TaxID=138072 RepID=UPI00130E0D51|nr:bis(5'-nucleosyl)-tetraphosphatase (symmetrical) ApaH [Candidatus Hamiltonella defensa]
MSNYLIGDVHGCFDELKALLAKVNFDKEKDTLWLTGDLVSRGLQSLEVLRYARSLGKALRMVLGNHDLHLLAIYARLRKNNPQDHLTALLSAPDVDELIDWLRQQPILQIDNDLKLIMTHAGIHPQWNKKTAQKCAKEIENMLLSDHIPLFLDKSHTETPHLWSPELKGDVRLQFMTNVLTRMRYCFSDGSLDMTHKEVPEKMQGDLYPWFLLPRLLEPEYAIAFGHWSSLKGKGTPNNIYALDTGCCWGNELTLLHWEEKRYVIQPSYKCANAF